MTEQNIGFVSANNLLFNHIEGDILILLNPDTLLVNDSLIELIEFITSRNDVAIAGPMLLNEDETYQVSYTKFPTLSTLFKEHILLYKKNPYTYSTDIFKSQECDVIKGACMVIKRKYLPDNTIFDNQYIMYSEEVDLCKRVQLKGLKTYYFAGAKIIHYGEKSSSLSFASEYSLYNYYRSRLLFYYKFSNKLYYTAVKSILIISLFGKSILLFFLTHFKNSKLHLKVLKKIINETKNINSLQRNTTI